MRKALNENPMVQIAVLAVLAVGVGLLLLVRMGGGGSEPASSTTTPTTPTTAAPATGTAAPAAPAPSTSAPATPDTGTTPPPVAPGEESTFTAGPGLPKPVVTAYEQGDAIALLVYRRKGIDDAFVNTFVRLLERSADPAVASTAVFYTNAHNVAKYSRITEGVNVSRTPALVVVKPKRLSEGGMPLASVSYGFRDPLSIVQAVEDALYKGPQVPSYPE